MRYLEKVIEDKLLDRRKLSTSLDINYQTLTHWIKHRSIDKHIEFIKLLIFLEIDIKDFVKKYDKDV